MVDDALRNDDWIKTGRWDLWRTDYSGPVGTLQELQAALGYGSLTEAEWRDTLRHLVTLPFWEPAPDQLKRETAAYLSG